MEQFTKIWDSGNRQNFGGLLNLVTKVFMAYLKVVRLHYPLKKGRKIA